MDSISCARAVPVAARATRQRAANRIRAILRIKPQPPGYGFEAGTSGLIQSTANGLRSDGLLASYRQDYHAPLTDRVLAGEESEPLHVRLGGKLRGGSYSGSMRPRA